MPEFAENVKTELQEPEAMEPVVETEPVAQQQAVAEAPSLADSSQEIEEARQRLSVLNDVQLEERVSLARQHPEFQRFWELCGRVFDLAPRLPRCGRSEHEHGAKGTKK